MAEELEKMFREWMRWKSYPATRRRLMGFYVGMFLVSPEEPE